MTKVTETKLSEIKPDQTNANRHTERGEGMIRQSISKYGFAEAGTLDKDNNIIGGNLRAEASADLGMEDAVIVDVDGTKPVYLRRGDLSLTDPNDNRARELAYALNRVPQVSIDFNPVTILADLDSGVDLSGLFREDELSEFEEEALLAGELAEAMLSPDKSQDRKLGDKQKQIKPVLYADEIATFEQAIKATGIKNRGEAIITVCRHYLDDNEKGQFNF